MYLKFRQILMDNANADGSASGNGTTTQTPAETPATTQNQGDSVSGTTDGQKSAEGAPNETGGNSDQSQPNASTEQKLEVDLKGLEETKVADVLEFAKTHNLTKEQAQALVDQRKEELDSSAAAATAAAEKLANDRKEIHAKWEKELQEDPEFGGQKYSHNIHINNKMINEHMPELKNLLTNSGAKLPPKLMKELNAVARKLYSEAELVEGSGVKSSDDSDRKPWDFYGKK